MKKSKSTKSRPKKKTVKLPFYKQKWFLMLAGLAAVAFVFLQMPVRPNPDVLGVSSGEPATLWSILIFVLTH